MFLANDNYLYTCWWDPMASSARPNSTAGVYVSSRGLGSSTFNNTTQLGTDTFDETNYFINPSSIGDYAIITCKGLISAIAGTYKAGSKVTSMTLTPEETLMRDYISNHELSSTYLTQIDCINYSRSGVIYRGY
jgi:hypothetical protein